MRIRNADTSHMRVKQTWSIVVAGIVLASSALAEKRSPEIWGGLTELCQWGPGPVNLVTNPSFEEKDETGGIAGWKMHPGVVRPTDTEAHLGKTSLVIRDGHNSRRAPLATQSLELVPGWYHLSGWIKAEDAGGNNPGAGGRIGVHGKQTNGVTPIVHGTTDWKKVAQQKFVSPGGPVEVRVTGYRKPSGSLFFDDIELRRLVAPTVEGFLLYPNYRGMLFPDKSETIRVAITLRADEVVLSLHDLEIRISLAHEEGSRVVLERRIVPSGPEFVLELDASNFAAGPYLLDIAVHRSGTGEFVSRCPSYRVFKLSFEEFEKFRTYIDEDNVLVLDRKRKFALGIYNTGGYGDSPDDYDRLLSKLSEAPLDLYINYWLGGTSNRVISALTDAMQSRGIYYLHTVNGWYEDLERWPQVPACVLEVDARTLGESAYAACRARELQSTRGLAGWYTADERPASRAPKVFQQYRALRENDPDGVTFIAQNKMKELVHWRDATDVMGVDPYPIYGIPEGEHSPLEMVFDWVSTARNTVQDGRPVWAVIQFFKFGAKGHWPTYDELRTMSYMAIVAGAKGLFYWSYGAKGLAWVKDPAQKEKLWQELVRLTKEIKSLEPVLLQADAPEILKAAPPSSIQMLAKQYEDVRFVIAVNTSSQEVPFQFHLTEPAESVTVEGENRTIQIESSFSFRDSFAPYAAHIYRIPAAAR